jgi:hypothetical protein
MAILRLKALRRKRLYYSLMLVLLLMAGAVFLYDRKPPADPFRANFDRIQKGMSREEVAAILGPPQGSTVPGVPGLKLQLWVMDRVEVRVAYRPVGDSTSVVFKTYDDRPMVRQARRWWERNFRGQAPF